MNQLQLLPRIPPAVARKLGHYVYVYVDPADESAFYIGKGQNGRALVHLKADERRRIFRRIRVIRAAGNEPRIDILSHGLPDAATALHIEAAAIELLGIDNLANAVRGWRSGDLGRAPLRDVVAHYTRKPPVFKEPAVLIRINKLYRCGMSEQALYDATRSAWRVRENQAEVKLAMAVFHGVVREVYRITGWLTAGTTFNTRYGGRRKNRPGRREFVGVIAEGSVRRRYLHKFVGDHFSFGNQNPVRYVFPTPAATRARRP